MLGPGVYIVIYIYTVYTHTDDITMVYLRINVYVYPHRYTHHDGGTV